MLIALPCSHDKVWNLSLKNRECVGVTVGNKDLFDHHKVARRQFKLQMVSADFSFSHLSLCLKFRCLHKENLFLSLFKKEIKMWCGDEICSNICSRGTVHSYEITLVYLISVLLVGQTIEISLPLGLQCSISVLHLMYYITKCTRGNFEVSRHHWL